MFIAFYLPHKYADIILGTVITGNREDARTHCYFIVDLNKAWAEEVITTRRLICITLSFVWEKEILRK